MLLNLLHQLTAIWHQVFWGGAIVIFLAKIINLHNPNLQGFWIEISAQIVNGKDPDQLNHRSIAG